MKGTIIMSNAFAALVDEKKAGFAKRIAKVSYESRILENINAIDNLDFVSMVQNQYQLLDCPDEVWKGVKASERRIEKYLTRHKGDEDALDLLLDIGLLEVGLAAYFGWNVEMN